MPVLESSKKALRRDKRRTSVNRKIRDRVKLAVIKVKQEKTAKALAAAYSALDRAAKKGVIHKNKAARIKSRLTVALKRDGGVIKAAKKAVKNSSQKSKPAAKVKKSLELVSKP